MPLKTAQQEEVPLGATPCTYQTALPWLLMFLGAVLGYAIICMLPHETADEGFHGPQIWSFYCGNYKPLPDLSMVPGYHFILAFVCRQLGVFNLDLLRFLSACLSLLALPIFYKFTRIYHGKEAPIRTLQLLFLPLLYPFFFLIYTDIPALMSVLLVWLFCLRRQHIPAAIAGILALLLRQNNIIWIGLGVLLVCLESGGDSGKTQANSKRGFALPALTQVWPYIAVFILFGLFVIYNGGVATGDQRLQRMSINLTGVYFLLLCGWAAFLPYNIVQAPKIWRLLLKPWIAASAVAGLVVYLATFRVTHQYNAQGLDFYLHNRVLTLMTNSAAWRTVLYIPMLWMVLSAASTQLPQKRFRWIYPVIVLAICLHPMVEVRYTFVALALFLALRPPMQPAAEIATLAYYIPVAAYLIYATARMQLFL
jgi:alpha-1,2-glucosyltransferase